MKRSDAYLNMTWHVAMLTGQAQVSQDCWGAMGEMIDKTEKNKAGVRVSAGHTFLVIKRQFNLAKVRYKGLSKNAAQIDTLFTSFNLWMVRHDLMGLQV